MLLDGAAKASTLPPTMTVQIRALSSRLANDAVLFQREHGCALTEMLGVIVGDAEELVTGVGRAEELLAGFREAATETQRQALEDFLARPIPPTHLRVIVWTDEGVAHLRVDVVSPKGGVS